MAILRSARGAFEKVLELIPNNPEGHNPQAGCCLRKGNKTRRLRIFGLRLLTNPSIFEGTYQFSQCAGAEGQDHDGAVRQAREAVRDAPPDILTVIALLGHGTGIVPSDLVRGSDARCESALESSHPRGFAR